MYSYRVNIYKNMPLKPQCGLKGSALFKVTFTQTRPDQMQKR